MADAPLASSSSVVMPARRPLALGADPSSPLVPDRRPGCLDGGKGGSPPLPSLWGHGSLAHRADSPVATSVTMPPPASRTFVAARRIVTFA